jgi:hypothetical protein
MSISDRRDHNYAGFWRRSLAALLDNLGRVTQESTA